MNRDKRDILMAQTEETRLARRKVVRVKKEKGGRTTQFLTTLTYNEDLMRSLRIKLGFQGKQDKVCLLREKST